MNGTRHAPGFVGPLALKVGLLLAVSVVFGALFNTLSPAGISWTGSTVARASLDVRSAGLLEASLDEARAIIEAGTATVYDARPLVEYDAGRLPGALSAPAAQLAASLEFVRAASPGKSDHVLVYCSGLHCTDALKLARALKDDGYTSVVVFTGGMEAWRAAGLTEEK